MKALAEVQEIDPKAVRVFVSRARPKAEWEALRDSMAEMGLKQPIEVRDISHLPASERERPDGGLFKWELNFGEGRLTAALALGWAKIPAMVAEVKEHETVGRFLAENLIRDPLPWYERAQLVAEDRREGLGIKETAAKYFITPTEVERLEKIVSKTAQGLEAEVGGLAVRQAEALTKLPAKHQTIVMEVFRETGERQITSFLRKAKAVVEEGRELSPMALRASLEAVTEQLRRTREVLKLKRLHHSLGPQNLATLLADKRFRAAARKAGLNVARFEEISR